MRPEDKIQKSFCDLLAAINLFHYSIPNGTHKQSNFSRWLHNVTGLRSGMPDLHIPAVVRSENGSVLFYSTYIETKTPAGRLSKDQISCHKELAELGHTVIVCRALDELIAYIKQAYPQYAKRIANTAVIIKLKNK